MIENFECVMEFIDESPSFVHGYECGTISQKLQSGSILVGYLMHTENSAQVQMICDLYKIKCFIKVIDETWSELSTNVKDDGKSHDYLDQ